MGSVLQGSEFKVLSLNKNGVDRIQTNVWVRAAEKQVYTVLLTPESSFLKTVLLFHIP